MGKPTVYGPKYSTFTRTVCMALNAKGVEYAQNEIDIMKPRPQGYLAMHPFGKVPAFEHDGFKLYESDSIARYIDDTFPGAKLQPTDAKGRARMNQMLSILTCYAYPSMISTVAIQRLFAPQADEEQVKAAMPTAETSLDALETLIGDGDYLAGRDLSLADLMAAPIFDYFDRTPEGKRAIAKRPKVAAWWQRIQQHPTVAKTKF